eukprot:scaffold69970_cov69-Phaeocystis_antarctica.AAC.5
MDAFLNEPGYFTPTDPVAKCMMNGMFCGCIAPFTGKIVRDKKGNDQITMTENTWLFCLPPSPCPCCMCCGVGPCAQKPRFIKETQSTSARATACLPVTAAWSASTTGATRWRWWATRSSGPLELSFLPAVPPKQEDRRFQAEGKGRRTDGL